MEVTKVSKVFYKISGNLGGGVFNVSFFRLIYTIFFILTALICNFTVKMENVNIYMLSGKLEFTRYTSVAFTNFIVFFINIYKHNKIKSIGVPPVSSWTDSVFALGCITVAALDFYLRPPKIWYYWVGKGFIYWGLLHRTLSNRIFINAFSGFKIKFKELHYEPQSQKNIESFIQLNSLCSDMNKLFGFQMLFYVALMFYIMTSSSYLVIKHSLSHHLSLSYMADMTETFVPYLIEIFWLILTASELLVIVRSCTQLVSSSQKYVDKLFMYHLEKKDDVTNKEKWQFRRVLRSGIASVSPFGIFTIDNGFVSSVVSMYITYLLVLVQFGSRYTSSGTSYLETEKYLQAYVAGVPKLGSPENPDAFAYSTGGMMSPGGPMMSPGGPMMGPGGPMMSPGGPMMGPGGPMMSPGGPMMSPGGPMMSPGGPMMSPGGPMMGPGGPMMSPGGPMMSPGGPMMSPGGPMMSPGGPMMSPGGPMMSPGGPMMSPGGPYYFPDGPFWNESTSLNMTLISDPNFDGLGNHDTYFDQNQTDYSQIPSQN